MAMINYADKVALNNNSNIADINKCNATDMNELKKAFNNQVAFGWYQTGLSPTFTYVSWDSSVCTGVVNSSLDLTPYLSVGMKIKFTQNSAIKYAFITAITSTQITLFMGTDYTLTNAPISDAFYSIVKSPYGFPLDEDKWSIVYTDYTNRSQLNPTNGTWYNPDNISKTLPIGQYRCYWKTALQVNSSSSTGGRVIGTISTTTNSETISQFTVMFNVTLYQLNVISNVSCQHTLNLTTKTTFYFLIKSLFSADIVQFNNSESTMLFKATIAYL